MALLTQTEILAKQKEIVVAQQKVADLQHELQSDANARRLATIEKEQAKVNATP